MLKPRKSLSCSDPGGSRTRDLRIKSRITERVGAGDYDGPAPVFDDLGADAEICIYAIRRADTSEIKIGCAEFVEKRLASLQVAHGEPLQLVVWFRHTKRAELLLHAYFSESRKLGEWFRESEKIRDWLGRQRVHKPRDAGVRMNRPIEQQNPQGKNFPQPEPPDSVESGPFASGHSVTNPVTSRHQRREFSPL